MFALLACTLAWLQVPLQAFAVCRIVEPIEERGGVAFDATTAVLYVRALDQVLARECVPADSDMDGGANEDGGSAPVTSGPCTPGMQAIERRGPVVHMVVQPSVLSTGRAGLVMPVPSRPDVHTANPDLFTALGERLQPRIVETRIEIEDESLGYQCRDPKWGGSSSSSSSGCGGDDYDPGASGDRDSGLFDPSGADDPLQRVMFGDGEVSFANALSTRDYDVTVLNASSAAALGQWLDQNGYAHDAIDDEAFAAYVNEGAWFVALDVHPQGFRDLEPLVLSWPGASIPIPHRLQYDPMGGELITNAFVMAESRMDAADGSAVTLYAAPAGFGGELRGFGLANGWITQLRMTRETSERRSDSRIEPVLNLEERPVLQRKVKVRIPSSKCPSEGESSVGCGCALQSRGQDRLAATFLPSVLALLWLALRARRRNDR